MSTVVYTVEEAADILKICRSTMFILIRDNKIRSIKIGNSRRIPDRAIDEYLNGLLEGAA